MTTLARSTSTRCRDCTLRQRSVFRPLDEPAIALLEAMKIGEIALDAGTNLTIDGDATAAIYTLLDGWAIRYLRRDQERRQILEILLPGDTIGVAAAVTGRSNVDIGTLTRAHFCVLHMQTLPTILSDHPGLALDLLRTQLDDAERADMRLASWGQLSGRDRVGLFLIEMYERLRRRDMVQGPSCAFPLRGVDVADAVGLSRVHVARALRLLRDEDLAHMRRGRLVIPDPERLALVVGHRFDPAPAPRVIL